MKTLAFIGGGAMATAMLAGILKRGLLEPDKIMVSEPRADQCALLTERFGVLTTIDNAKAAQWGEVVILAVKPQLLSVVLPPLQGQLHSDSLLLSVVAGAKISTLSEGFAHSRIVRTIPNTPATIGQGITAWLATPSVTAEQRVSTAKILSALGEQVEVQNETMIDMATGVSGSGPAYVFLLMEAMMDGAVRLGLSRPVAEQLVLQTFAGSVAYAQQSTAHLAALRHQVTSPGGTTAAGLHEMELAGIRATLANTVMAAFRRSQELGEK
jgi:pyrroline-5-carboxylate reductase